MRRKKAHADNISEIGRQSNRLYAASNHRHTIMRTRYSDTLELIPKNKRPKLLHIAQEFDKKLWLKLQLSNFSYAELEHLTFVMEIPPEK